MSRYNLDAIISVGRRVKSLRGTRFRRWALEVLKEYSPKGFAMNDDRPIKGGGGHYWRELLERARDIRSNDKIFSRGRLTSASQALTATRGRRNRLSFSKRRGTRRVSRRAATPPPKSSPPAPTPTRRSRV
jgi:hypothetical protein